MTDRIKYLTVGLDQDYRDDDADAIVNAFRHPRSDTTFTWSPDGSYTVATKLRQRDGSTVTETVTRTYTVE